MTDTVCSMISETGRSARPSSRPVRHCRFFARAASLTALGVGSLVLLGWLLNLPLLKSGLPGGTIIKPNTAACFVLAGLALGLLDEGPGARRTPAPWRTYAARICAVLVALVGFLTLGEYLLHVNLGLDEVLFRDTPDPAPLGPPGRMAPATALGFLLLGSALGWLEEESHRGHWLAQYFALLTLLVGLTAALGHLYEAEALYRITIYSAMAPLVALVFLVLGAGVLALRPHRGLLALVTREAAGSVMARRLLPVVIVLPLLTAWVRLQGQQAGLYGTAFGAALFTISMIIILTAVVLGIARSLNQNDTQRHRAEEHTRQLLHALEMTPNAVITLDLDARVTSWSVGATRLYGYEAHEILGRVGFELLVPASLPEERLSIPQRVQRRESVVYETQRVTKAGAVLDVEVSYTPMYDEEGTLVGQLSLSRDITERKRLEAALQQERDLLAVTLASIGDAVIATDATAVITFMNPVAEILTGWPAPAAQGRPLAEVFRIINEQTRQLVANPVEKVLGEGRIVGLANHTALLTRDGREVPIADSGSPICGTSGQLHGTILVFRDVTEHKQAEEALVRAKEAAETADQLKGEFLATMSHELRTPLNVILGYTEMLLDGGVGELSAAQQTMLTKIQRNSQVLFELISMVLDLNRLQAGRMPVDVQEVHIAELFAEVQVEMQGLCEQSGLACQWQAAAELPPLATDRGKLKVVLKNLVSNAVKFTPEGGVTVAAEEQRRGIEIRVVDTGIGIAPEAQAFIFEPFRQVDSSDTRAYSGSGLGLHIVKRLLEVLGGTVTVESEVGQGSTFRVWLPCA